MECPIAEQISLLLAKVDLPRWMTADEAGTYARMSRNTLMKYVKSGDIYAKKVGGLWIVDRDSIDAFYSESHEVLLHLKKTME